jgi:hypothetical protein
MACLSTNELLKRRNKVALIAQRRNFNPKTPRSVGDLTAAPGAIGARETARSSLLNRGGLTFRSACWRERLASESKR